MEKLLDESGISYTLSKINKEFTRYINLQLQQYNITRAEAPILLTLYSGDGVTQEYISKCYHLNEATVTRTVKRMENKGIVERKSDSEDKRKKLLFITDDGRKIAEELIRIQDEFENELFSSFSDDELDAFKKLTDKLLENFYSM